MVVWHRYMVVWHRYIIIWPRYTRVTLEEFRGSVGGTAAKGVQLGVEAVLVGEAKVCYLDVQVFV